MARAAKKKPVGKRKAPKKKRIKLHPIEWIRLWIKRAFLAILAFFALGIVGYAFINPPTTPHIIAEKLRLGWAAIDEGGARGASTLTQQVVKNVYLWHGRSWPRKALEAGITPFVELFWSKRRIVEVYLNIAEFDEGVFGVEAASRHYFGVGPENLTAVQAARLAALLPNPKERSAARPSPFVRKRAQSILDGAATIRADGRASCFED